MNTQMTSHNRTAFFTLASALLFVFAAGPAAAQSRPPVAAPAPVTPLDLRSLDLTPLSPRALAELQALDTESLRAAALAELQALDLAPATKALAERRALDTLIFSDVQGRVLTETRAALETSFAEAQAVEEASRAQVRSSEAEIRSTENRIRAIESQIESLQKQLQDAQAGGAAEQAREATRKNIAAKTEDLKAAQAQLKEQQAKLAALQRTTRSLGRAFTVTRTLSEQGTYDRGVSALDQARWQRAIDAFDEVSKAKSKRADGALYWKAYAQHRLGQRAEALATLQELQKSYASSRWSNDAKALEVEVRQSMGQPVRPEGESDDDLKLMALNSVVMSDPERGIPIIEKFLQGTAAPKLKKQALFLLAQTGTPKARDVLVQVAKGSGNPDLQIQAVRYLGMFGRHGLTNVFSSRTGKSTGAAPGVDTTQALSDIYNSTSDVDVKREILRSFMMARDKDRLLALAKGERDPELRGEAVRQLGMMGAQAELFALYTADLSTEVRQQIISAMVMSRSADRLLEIARNEKDPKLKVHAVRNLGMLAGPRVFAYSGRAYAYAGAAGAAAIAPVPPTAPAPPTPPAAPVPPGARAPTPAAPVPAIAGEAGSEPVDTAKIADGLVSIYKSDKDQDVRKAVVSALFMMQNAKALVDIARQETDPAMKKDLVQKLSMMKSKEATDYMMELLK